MFVAELFRGISHRLENSSDQGPEPTFSTKYVFIHLALQSQPHFQVIS